MKIKFSCQVIRQTTIEIERRILLTFEFSFFNQNQNMSQKRAGEPRGNPEKKQRVNDDKATTEKKGDYIVFKCEQTGGRYFRRPPSTGRPKGAIAWLCMEEVGGDGTYCQVAIEEKCDDKSRARCKTHKKAALVTETNEKKDGHAVYKCEVTGGRYYRRPSDRKPNGEVTWLCMHLVGGTYCQHRAGKCDDKAVARCGEHGYTGGAKCVDCVRSNQHDPNFKVRFAAVNDRCTNHNGGTKQCRTDGCTRTAQKKSDVCHVLKFVTFVKLRVGNVIVNHLLKQSRLNLHLSSLNPLRTKKVNV